MDKWQAIHKFWSGFGIPAYEQSSVPDNAQFPYITYTASAADFERVVQLTATIWYRSTSLAEISKKTDEIARALTPYKIIKIDGGYVFIAQGSPFAQPAPSEDYEIKGKYIVAQAEFFTGY